MASSTLHTTSSNLIPGTVLNPQTPSQANTAAAAAAAAAAAVAYKQQQQLLQQIQAQAKLQQLQQEQQKRTEFHVGTRVIIRVSYGEVKQF
jgi:uncharacterized OsmC-like protein